jgi:hypothetical protein
MEDISVGEGGTHAEWFEHPSFSQFRIAFTITSSTVSDRRRRRRRRRRNVRVCSQGEEINRSKFRRHKFADFVFSMHLLLLVYHYTFQNFNYQ